MDKFSFISLWDAYQGLLTENQREITDLYFNLDLTVSEIATEKNISRQAVSECLKGCKAQLEEYEEKLHLLERLQGLSLEISSMVTKAEKWAEGFTLNHAEYSDEIEELRKILKIGG